MPDAAQPAAQPAALRDFGDWISPMLVKELRQGLKSPVFIWGLITMQVVLVCMALLAADEGADYDATVAFWWSLCGPVCLLLPLRVANALREETSGNTMDSLIMTKLSAWRITFGKWTATAALQVLVTITLAPYVIMRYFGGGINLPSELLWTGLFLLMGMLATAILLGLSFLRYFLLRAAVMVAVVAAMAGACGGIVDSLGDRDRDVMILQDREGRQVILYFLIAAVWVGFFFLDLGAGQIAPRAENRSTRRRLVALTAIVVLCGLGWWKLTGASGTFERALAFVAFFLSACIGTLASLQAICERPAHFATVVRPFVGKGGLGRLAGRLLYPGWHSGVVFFLALTLFGTVNMLTAVLEGAGPPRRGRYEEALLTVVMGVNATIGFVLFPLGVYCLSRRMTQWNFWRWLLVTVAAFAFQLLCFVIWSERKVTAAAYPPYVVPSSNAMSWEVSREESRTAIRHMLYSTSGNLPLPTMREEYRRTVLSRLLIAGSASTLAWLIVVLVAAAREFRLTGALEREVRDELRLAGRTASPRSV